MASTSGPIRIGASLSLTGPNAAAGITQKQGYELWRDTLNAAAGLLGRPVELVTYDDTGDPTAATKLYDKLLGDDKVDLVLGPSVSSVTLAASTVTEKRGSPMLAAGMASADIWKRNYQYVFGVAQPPEAIFTALVDLALKNNLRKLAFVNEDTVVPNATVSAAMTYARQKGMQVVYAGKYPPKATSEAIGALLDKARDAAPDALLAGTYGDDALLITQRLSGHDVPAKLVAYGGGASGADYLTAAGAAAEGALSPSAWEPEVKTPGNAEFVAAFEAKYGAEPDARAATAYAAGQALEAAVKKAGSLDNEKLREALASLDAPTILPGKFKVDDTGLQVGHVPVIVQWQSGKRAIVSPDDQATGKLALRS